MRVTLRICWATFFMTIFFSSMVYAGLKDELCKYTDKVGTIGDTPIVSSYDKIFSSVKYEIWYDNVNPWFLFKCEDIDSYHGRLTLFEPIKEKPFIKNVVTRWVRGRQVAEIQITKRITHDGGVRIVEWISSNALIAGKQTIFILKNPRQGENAIKFVGVSNIISEPGLIAVLIRPDYRKDAEKWFSNRGYIFRRSFRYFNHYMEKIYGKNWEILKDEEDKEYIQRFLEFYNLQHYKEILHHDFFMQPHYYGGTYKNNEFLNLYILHVPIGTEHEACNEILKQKWSFDVSVDFHHEGPTDSYLHFPYESIFRNVEEQQALRKRFISVLKQKFTSMDISTENFVANGPGLKYQLKLKVPMEKIGIREFEGYWLMADVIFECFHNKTTKGVLYDEIVIKIPDGFIARWNTSGVPPEGHFDHLSPMGKTKYHDFSSLKWLMEAIGNHIAYSWNGTFNPAD